MHASHAPHTLHHLHGSRYRPLHPSQEAERERQTTERVLQSKETLLRRAQEERKALREALEAAGKAKGAQCEREAALHRADDSASEQMQRQTHALRAAEASAVRLAELAAWPAHSETTPAVCALLAEVDVENATTLAAAERLVDELRARQAAAVTAEEARREATAGELRQVPSPLAARPDWEARYTSYTRYDRPNWEERYTRCTRYAR